MSGTDKVNSYNAVRNVHGQLSKQLIIGKPGDYQQVFNNRLFSLYENAIATVCAYHQKNEPLNEQQEAIFKEPMNGFKQEAIKETTIVNDEEIRLRLLAAILQLADACDVTVSRTVISPEAKRKRNERAMEEKVRAVSDRIQYLMNSGHAARKLLDDICPYNANQSYSVSLILNSESIFNAIEKQAPDSRLAELFGELSLIAQQYQNHYLLHSKTARVGIDKNSLTIEPSCKSSGSDQNFYIRQIHITLGEDLFLTFPELHANGLQLRTLKVDGGLPMTDERRFDLRKVELDAEVIRGISDTFKLEEKKIEKLNFRDTYFDDCNVLAKEKMTFRLRCEESLKRPARYTVKVKCQGKKEEAEILLTELEYEKCLATGDFSEFRSFFLPVMGESVARACFAGLLQRCLAIETERTLYPLKFTSSNMRQSKVSLVVDKCRGMIDDRECCFRQLELQEQYVEKEDFEALVEEVSDRLKLEPCQGKFLTVKNALG